MKIANLLILGLLYLLPLLSVGYVLRLLRETLLQRRVPFFSQFRHYYGRGKEQFVSRYRVSALDRQFAEAGLIAAGFTPAKYRMLRDAGFAVHVLIIHAKYLASADKIYPAAGLAALVILYTAAQLRRRFPAEYLLGICKKRHDGRKNGEIFILQQMVSSEFADVHGSKQNIYHLFFYLRRFVRYIRPAMDRFLEEYPLDPLRKDKAFDAFSRAVGTPEAEALAQVLYQVDQSSPGEVRDILSKRYDELKKKRQEMYRRSMRDRGTSAYVITFSGVLMVIVCGLFVYYLEYKDLIGAAYNLN